MRPAIICAARCTRYPLTNFRRAQSAKAKRMSYLFLDTETTGLEAGIDEITEIAWIARLNDGREFTAQYFVEHSRLPNEWVLKNTDYMNRIALAEKYPLREVLRFLSGVVELNDAPMHMVGACPAFDDRFLRAAFAAHKREVPYHYHVIDIEAMAFGALGLPTMPPLKELRSKLGIPGENEAAHTALADAREAMLIFDAIRARATH